MAYLSRYAFFVGFLPRMRSVAGGGNSYDDVKLGARSSISAFHFDGTLDIFYGLSVCEFFVDFFLRVRCVSGCGGSYDSYKAGARSLNRSAHVDEGFAIGYGLSSHVMAVMSARTDAKSFTESLPIKFLRKLCRKT